MSAEDDKTTPRLPVSTPVWFKIFLTDGFQNLVDEVHKIKEVSESNNDMLRGKDGEPGLLTKFAMLDRKVDDVFSAGSKILLYVITGSIGFVFFIVTSVLGVIIYHVITTR